MNQAILAFTLLTAFHASALAGFRIDCGRPSYPNIPILNNNAFQVEFTSTGKVILITTDENGAITENEMTPSYFRPDFTSYSYGDIMVRKHDSTGFSMTLNPKIGSQFFAKCEVVE